MKKLFLALAAFAVLFTACQKEEPTAEEVAVSITLDAASATTRAAVANSSSDKGGVFNIDENEYDLRYILEIFDLNGNRVKEVDPCYVEEFNQGSTQATFSFRLMPGEYKFVAFADFVKVQGEDLHYVTADGLDRITLNSASQVNINDESRDMYFGAEVIDVQGSLARSLFLKRPFGKLRVVATDYNELNIGTEVESVEVKYTLPSIANFNAFNGEVTYGSNEEYTYSNTLFPYANEGNALTDGRKTLSIDYIFANENENKTIQFKFTARTNNTQDVCHDFTTDIPVKRNALTTLIGGVLTYGQDITVDVLPDFDSTLEEEFKVVSEVKDFYDLIAAIANGGNYILVTDLNITSAPVSNAPMTRAAATTTTVLNLNGKTITVNNTSNEPLATVGAGHTLTFAGEGEVEQIAGTFIEITDDGQLNIAGNITYDETVFEGNVTNYYTGLIEAFADGGEFTLGADVTISGEKLTLANGKNLTIDLNGYTIAAKTVGNTNPQEFILVKGNLTINNGTITLDHVGQNMGWGGMTTIFDVTAGGVLNLNEVTAKNFGGTDMGFVAHLNNWGEVTLNVEKSTLESNYVAVRVFNSGNDMNNVTIRNSTLKGGNYAFWVHNYTFADFGSQAKVDAHEALLNLDIFDGTNVFIGKTATPIRYGFTNSLYCDAENTLCINTLAELKSFAKAVNEGMTFKGRNVKLVNDIDLAGEEWTPIGSAYKDHGFMGNFDGNGKTIKNLTITDITPDADGYVYAGLFGVTEGVDANNQNYIKNLTIENVNIATEGHIVAAAIAYPYYTIVENVTVKGNISIKGGDYTAGVLAYTRRCVDATNITIAANEGSSIEGNMTVGGVISDIQMNGGLTANYSNFAASGLTLKGAMHVGGISGIICGQTLNGAKVENVVINCDDVRKGILCGSFSSAGTKRAVINNVSYSEVTGATRFVGSTFKADSSDALEIDGVVYNYDANGVKVDGSYFVATQADLNNIVKSDDVKALYLAPGNYTLPSISGKEIAISGTKDVVITVNKPNLGGTNLTLAGVTVKGSGYATGVQHVNTVTYNDVKIIGEMCLYGEAVTFNNCEFELSKGQYIWTYGVKNAKFENSVFNTNGKAILVYNEGAGANTVEVEGCTFNATAGDKAGAIANQNCAAIEIDNFQSSGVGAAHVVTTSNNTYSSNFSGEWRIKNYVAGGSVTVNGREYTQIAIDGHLMTIDANKNVTVK